MPDYKSLRPPLVPERGNRLTRWIGRTILSLIGWRIEGELHNAPKVVLIGAPHTSNWDLIIAMGAALAVGFRFSWMMKKEAFFWPLGPLWKVLGGIPIDRSRRSSMAEQMAAKFKDSEALWLGITPEGTRRKVERLRQGYLRIAYAADVPVFVVGLDGIQKRVVLDRIWPLTGDMEADNEAIKAYFDRTYIGVSPQ